MAGVDVSAPTFFLSECVLVYLGAGVLYTSCVLDTPFWGLMCVGYTLLGCWTLCGCVVHTPRVYCTQLEEGRLRRAHALPLRVRPRLSRRRCAALFPRLLFGELFTYKTVRTRIWSWLLVYVGAGRTLTRNPNPETRNPNPET